MNLKRIPAIETSLLLVFILLGCSKPASLTKPEAPAAKYLYTDMEIKNEKYLSSLNVPVSIPLSELAKQVNSQLNGLIYEDNSYEDDNQDNLKVKVWKLSDVKVTGDGPLFFFEVPLKIWVSAGYKLNPLGFTVSGYKETEFSIRVKLVSQISISSDWQLITTTKVDGYDWISEPKISVAGINIPIKSMVGRTLNKNSDKITEAIDDQLKKTVEIKKYVRQAWAQAQEPTLISPEFDTWMVLSPLEILMTPLTIAQNKISSTVTIKGYTQTITSQEKPTRSLGYTLPPLKIVQQANDQFKVGILSFISYQEASRMAEKNFKGKKFEFSNGKYVIEVADVEIYGQNEKLVIKTGLTGSLNGTIYLKGTPHYDPATGLVRLQNLDYDLSTRNILAKAAGWILQSKFASLMEKQLVFPAGEQIKSIKDAVQESITHKQVSKGIEINGTISEITPDKIYLTPDHIYAVVFATGKVNLKIEGLL